MSRQVELVILCEDQQQAVFARHYFIERGFHPRKIRVRISPRGEGSGEQYVREQYPQEMRAYRRRSAYLSTILVVVIDADTVSVQARLQQLDQALTATSQEKRQASERVAVFVPKRNIETWIHFVRGTAVDEETVYAKLTYPGECKHDVIKLARDICPAGLPPDAPPSLQTACEELQRILAQ